MALHSRIPVLILEDSRKRSSLSIEPSFQDDGHMRLFKEISGTSFSSDNESVGRISAFLGSMGAEKVIFEDSRKSVLTKLLRKSGYRLSKTYDYPRGARIHWRAWNEPMPPDMSYFGVAMEGRVSIGQACRRLGLSDRSGAVGEIAFTDHGRFVRAKANRFGSEGFGLAERGRDPSVLLTVLVREMLRERKRYLILGPEYSRISRPIHPFPLWHMTSSSGKEYDHRCRSATDADLGILAKLVSEYEDADYGTALMGVTKNFYNQSFRYLLTPGNEGFALLRFMEAAEGMINDLYVSPSHQEKGIGDELTRGSLTALSKNCLNIHLNTIYPRARRLYEKYGFNVLYEDLCVALNQRLMIRPAARKA